MLRSMTTHTGTSIDLLAFHQRAGAATRTFVQAIPPDAWSAPTNCDMDVRALVNHLVSGHYWAAALCNAETITSVGSRFEGDLLGAHPVAAYDGSLALAQAAFSRPGALQQTCTLSYGEITLGVYCSHRALDTFIHGWDIARATGQDPSLDADLLEMMWEFFSPHAAEFAASPAFGPRLDVPEDADTQTRLLAMLGRDNRRSSSTP